MYLTRSSTGAIKKKKNNHRSREPNPAASTVPLKAAQRSQTWEKEGSTQLVENDVGNYPAHIQSKQSQTSRATFELSAMDALLPPPLSTHTPAVAFHKHQSQKTPRKYENHIKVSLSSFQHFRVMARQKIWDSGTQNILLNTCNEEGGKDASKSDREGRWLSCYQRLLGLPLTPKPTTVIAKSLHNSCSEKAKLVLEVSSDLLCCVCKVLFTKFCAMTTALPQTQMSQTFTRFSCFQIPDELHALRKVFRKLRII